MDFAARHLYTHTALGEVCRPSAFRTLFDGLTPFATRRCEAASATRTRWFLLDHGQSAGIVYALSFRGWSSRLRPPPRRLFARDC